MDIFLKQQHGTLIQLRRLSQPPLWGKRATLVEPLKVTVDRGAVDPERTTGGLGFKDALLYGLYYLGAQIYGVGFHLLMMLGDPTSLQAAVGKGIPDKDILPYLPLATFNSTSWRPIFFPQVPAGKDTEHSYHKAGYLYRTM